MYDVLFEKTQDNDGNMYLVTNLVPLTLECTKISLVRNIIGPITPTALPIQRTVI